MPTNDFLPFGFSEDANVMSQAEYLTLTARNKGFSAGTAKSEQLNKAWRQSSLMAVTLAQFIVDQSGQSAVDDGTTAALQTHLLAAIQAASRQTTIIADTGVANAYAALNNPALTALPVTGYSQRVNIANANTGPSTYAPDGLAAKPVYGLALQPLQGGELPVGVAVMMYLVQPGVNGGNGAWVVIESLGAAAQVANATKSRHAVAAGQVQSQALTAFPSSGTSPALTLTPIPAISAYAVNQRFCVTFNAASTGADTLNVSGLGARGIKQYDYAGSKVAAVFALGQISDVIYDGTDLVLLDPLPVNVTPNVWASQPIGVPIPILYDVEGQTPPMDNALYRYIKLTASDSYNIGVLTGEVVSGSGATLDAQATISMTASPLNGVMVHLINTERRVLRAGSVRAVEQDAMQGHGHELRGSSNVVSNASYGPIVTNSVGNTVLSPTAAAPISDGVNGNPRIAAETRPKNIGVTYYMRIA
jgi:hypothetical protein